MTAKKSRRRVRKKKSRKQTKKDKERTGKRYKNSKKALFVKLRR
jgi:hypothetical protein